MKKEPAISLTERCEDIFELIIKKTITKEMVAQAFSNLKVKGYNYSEVKTILLQAGDIEPTIKTDIYTRQEVMNLFNWSDRTLRDTLLDWGLDHIAPFHKKEKIHKAARDNGWRYSEEDGVWIRPLRTKKR